MKLLKKSPWAFIVLIGVVSLFSDMTHEGARSITGPFLASLGTSATVPASIIPLGKRGTESGIFNAVFGLSWFLGSFLMGWLYDVSIAGLIVFSMMAQLALIPFFVKLSGKPHA